MIDILDCTMIENFKRDAESVYNNPTRSNLEGWNRLYNSIIEYRRWWWFGITAEDRKRLSLVRPYLTENPNENGICGALRFKRHIQDFMYDTVKTEYMTPQGRKPWPYDLGEKGKTLVTTWYYHYRDWWISRTTEDLPAFDV